MKKITWKCAAAALLLLAAALPAFAGGAKEKSVLKDGTYLTSAEGKNGPVQVETVIEGGAIKSVKALKNAETPGISDGAFARIPGAIVAGQTLKVDSVAGASYTSRALVAAVEAAVKQAGGKKEDFAKAAPAAKPGKAETYEADLVVLGAGAGGLTGAMEAQRRGLKVILLEKGANANVSNGANCGGPIAAGTRLQAAENATVSVETLFKHMSGYASWKMDGTLLRKVLAETGPTIDGFQDLGLEMFLRPDNYGMGFRARHGFKTPKGKRADFLTADFQKNGGTLLLETAGKELIKEGGRVAGVKARKADGTEVTVKAKAVLVATGGYLGNQEKIAQYFNGARVNSLGNQLSTGEGMDMMVAAGATLDWQSFGIISNEFSGTNQKAGPWSNTVENLTFPVYGGLIVDSRGTRFMDEANMAREPLSVGAAATLRVGKFYSVVDQTYYDAVQKEGIWSFLGEPASWYAGKMTQKGKKLSRAAEQLPKAIEQGWAFKADSIEALAARYGLAGLPAAVAEYNKYCAAGKDDQFYKDPAFLKPVSQGPFYVFEYENSAWGTLGGVKTDDCLRVLDAKNKPIPGLYAAGVDAGSLYTAPYYDNEGASVGLAFASGRVAAMEIAKAIKR